MHNILYDRETRKVTLVDFEVIGECSGAGVEVDNIIDA